MKMSVCVLVEMHETFLELDITESKNNFVLTQPNYGLTQSINVAPRTVSTD